MPPSFLAYVIVRYCHNLKIKLLPKQEGAGSPTPSIHILLILFENQIQTTSASPCRTQVQPAASFLVCSLIFIEYKKPILFLPSKQTDFSYLKPSKKNKDSSKINLLKNLSLALKFLEVLLIYEIIFSSILLAIFPKKIVNRRLIKTKKNPR